MVREKKGHSDKGLFSMQSELGRSQVIAKNALRKKEKNQAEMRRLSQNPIRPGPAENVAIPSTNPFWKKAEIQEGSS